MINIDYSVKISIITVSYNAVKTIEQTILSVINQSYFNIEYIIVDGGSTDGTVGIIKKYADKISYWVSEPDKGIYDAMNKGIDVATGEYVYFLGADDWIATNHMIKDVTGFIVNHAGYDFYCGKVFLYDGQYEMVKENGYELTLQEIKCGAMYPHQGMFTKLELLKSKFDNRYLIAADYDFLLKNIMCEKTIIFMNKCIAFYNIHGVSSSKELFYLYGEYKEIILKLCGEKYTDSITELQDNLSKWSIKKIVKQILIFVFGKKNFLRLRKWEKYKGEKM